MRESIDQKGLDNDDKLSKKSFMQSVDLKQEILEKMSLRNLERKSESAKIAKKKNQILRILNGGKK